MNPTTFNNFYLYTSTTTKHALKLSTNAHAWIQPIQKHSSTRPNIIVESSSTHSVPRTQKIASEFKLITRNTCTNASSDSTIAHSKLRGHTHDPKPTQNIARTYPLPTFAKVSRQPTPPRHSPLQYAAHLYLQTLHLERLVMRKVQIGPK